MTLTVPPSNSPPEPPGPSGQQSGTLATPTNLRFTDVTETTATMHWDTVPNATGYDVQVQVGANWNNAGTASTNSTPLSGVISGNTYTLRVRATASGFTTSAWSAGASFTAGAPAAQPDGTENNPYIITTIDSAVDVLSQLNLGANGVATFYRYNNPTVGDWEIVFSTTPGQDFDTHFRAKNASNANVDTDSEVTDNTPHTLEVTTTAATTWLQFEIQDWHSGGNPTAATLRLNSPTTTTQLSTPGSLSSSSVTHNSATVNWGAVTNASGYTIGYRTTGSTTWTDITIGSGTTTSRSITGLTASTGYDWRIRATGTGNFTNSGYSATQTFTTSAAPAAFGWSIVEASTTDTSITIRITGDSLGTVNAYLSTNDFVSSGDTHQTRQNAGDITFTGLTASTQYWLYASQTALPSDTTQGAPSNQVLTETTNAAAATYEFSNYNNSQVMRGDTLTAIFTGTAPAGTTYQWQFRNTTNDAWADLANQTTTSTVIHAQAVIGREYRIQWTVSGTTSSASTFATVIATPAQQPDGTENNPYIITTIDSAVNILSQLDLTDRSDTTYYRYNNPTPGAWEMVFDTTPDQDWDTEIAAYDGNTEQSSDSEAVDTTPHTLSVTANASTDNLRISLQFWEQTTNRPTGATLRLNSPTQTTQLDTPGSLSSDQVTHNSARISWGSVSNVTNYTYQYRIGTGARTTQTTTNTRVTLTGLTASSNYNWRVRANGTGNFSNSAYSGNQNFSTSATPSSSWQLFADRGVAGSAGPAGPGLRWRGGWSSTTSYSVRDLVHHNRSAWVATANSRNSTPSGTSNFWDIYAESGERGATGARGPTGPRGPAGADGEDGTAADRGPSLFLIQITSAQETSLKSAGNTNLPNALETLANAETPGANKFGDIVRFYRGNYSDYWAWTDATTDRWERMSNFIGANQISAVNISAITGSFSDLSVSGTLAANKISGDVQNARVLYDATLSGNEIRSSSTYKTITLKESLGAFDVLEIIVAADASTTNLRAYVVTAIPTTWYPFQSSVAISPAFATCTMQTYGAGRNFNIRRKSGSSRFYLYFIVGIKQP